MRAGPARRPSNPPLPCTVPNHEAALCARTLVCERRFQEIVDLNAVNLVADHDACTPWEVSRNARGHSIAARR